ncbi:hypothetical protein FisN_2Lh311 [Fistulifera solaris]|uniref:Transmembrane protein n=1 Tax=Fistulifera solaris TaxID=1519565 RepID=A0A1Z5KFP7_FISSO|nr:hypothetical protein FisN_2Lh311 [Fistulifera solaris]|eukprot:GAX25026.1 hypothetical protein FisN_2Lh311 [Fistulifera solaris]
MAMTTRLYTLLVVSLGMVEPLNAWLSNGPLRLSSSSLSSGVIKRTFCTQQRLHTKKKKNEGEDEEEDDSVNSKSGVGMERAFQQLEQLSFLPNDDDNNNNNNRLDNKNGTKIQASTEDLHLTSTSTPTPEQEVLLYKNMVQELEQTTEEDLYSNVLQDMGGGSGASLSVSATEQGKTADIPKPTTSADFLNQALSEALQQVQVNTPSAVDSILDDPELMNEIEAIFERGNAKLLEGLEAVRREQEQLTKASIAAQQQTKEEDAETQARLDAAERSMQSMLQRVNQERSNVEQAVQDLQRAQEQEENVLLKLKQNPLKQGALIGFLLFSFRSLTDSFAVLNDPSQDWAMALVQGAIALACAAVFYLL